MPVQAFIVMDATERAAAMLLNYADAGVNPRKIDNPLSNLLGFGTLLNMYVVPARLLNDEPYERWYEMFSDNAIHILDTDMLFLPPPPEEE